MASRINVAYIITDTRASVKKTFSNNLLKRSIVTSTYIVDSYTIDVDLSQKQLLAVAQMLTNPTIETFSINKSLAPKKFDWAIEIGFLPGVTDNVGSTVREAIEDLLHSAFDGQGVYTSRILFVRTTCHKNCGKFVQPPH